MKYKLIAMDLDGTLLDENSEISKENMEAIQYAKKQEVIIIISTGRPIQGIEKYYKQLKLSTPAITYNGGMIVNPVTKEVIFEQKLESDAFIQAYELGRKYDATMCVWSKNQLYVNKMNWRVEDYKKISGVEPVLIEDVEQLKQQGITKMLWYDEPEQICKYKQEMENMSIGEASFCTSKPYFLEIFSSKVSKAIAIEQIGKMYGISSAEMMAFGDGINDLEMIEYVGHGVAMENAEEELKNIADEIAPHHNESGVAKIIKKYVGF